jgi:hypothetical protein
VLEEQDARALVFDKRPQLIPMLRPVLEVTASLHEKSPVAVGDAHRLRVIRLRMHDIIT